MPPRRRELSVRPPQMNVQLGESSCKNRLIPTALFSLHKRVPKPTILTFRWPEGGQRSGSDGRLRLLVTIVGRISWPVRG